MLPGTNFTQKSHHDTYPAISPLLANLAGKSVFITGASKGVGKATALSYASAGCSRIAIGARSRLSSVQQEILSAAAAAKRPEPEIVCIELDITSKDSVAAAADTLEKRWASLDILINNAGYLENFVPLTDSDPDEYWHSWEVNYKGTYLVTRAFLPMLLNGELKTIVNVSSIGAHLLSPGASGYQTAKLALLRFAEFIDHEHGDEGKGIIAFSVHPGGIVTELAMGMPEAMHAMLTDTAELAGDALVWLTRERRSWLAGRYVSCVWDVDELERRKDDIVKGDLLKVRLAVGF